MDNATKVLFGMIAIIIGLSIGILSYLKLSHESNFIMPALKAAPMSYEAPVPNPVAPDMGDMSRTLIKDAADKRLNELKDM